MEYAALAREVKLDFASRTVTINVPYFKLTFTPNQGQDEEGEKRFSKLVSELSQVDNNTLVVRDGNEVQVYVKFDFGSFVPESLWKMANEDDLLPEDIRQQITGEIILAICKSCLPDIMKSTQKHAEELKKFWDKQTKEING